MQAIAIQAVLWLAKQCAARLHQHKQYSKVTVWKQSYNNIDKHKLLSNFKTANTNNYQKKYKLILGFDNVVGAWFGNIQITFSYQHTTYTLISKPITCT